VTTARCPAIRSSRHLDYHGPQLVAGAPPIAPACEELQLVSDTRVTSTMADNISIIESGLKASFKPWCYLICLSILAYFVFANVRSYRRLRHIPGPILGAFSNLWWIRAAISGQGHLALGDACTKYGRMKESQCSDRYGSANHTLRVHRANRSKHCRYKRRGLGKENECISRLVLHERKMVYGIQI
jgi:hypothetical protein